MLFWNFILNLRKVRFRDLSSSMLPPGGTDVPALGAGVSFHHCPCTSDAAWATNNEKTEQTNKLIYPNSTSFIFVYEQASTSLQFAFQLVEKWEQLQQTQRKLSVLKTLSPSILSKELKRKRYISGWVKQTIWDLVVYQHFHSSLTTSHGSKHRCVSCTLKSPHVSVTTVWLQFSLSGSGLDSTHFHLVRGLPWMC